MSKATVPIGLRWPLTDGPTSIEYHQAIQPSACARAWETCHKHGQEVVEAEPGRQWGMAVGLQRGVD